MIGRKSTEEISHEWNEFGDGRLNHQIAQQFGDLGDRPRIRSIRGLFLPLNDRNGF
jgi:hypothetical protein